jgi:putative hydrolase of the HAD superfamily
MLPEAILFDLDDTILVEDKAAELAWEKVCRITAEKTALFDGKELFKCINYIRKNYWNDAKRTSTEDKGRIDFYYARMVIVRGALNELGCDNNNIAEEIVSTFSTLKQESIEFIPDAENTLRELKNNGIKLALITNGDGNEQRTKIERFGMERFFNTCLVEGELGYGKPDPRIFQIALTQLAVNSKQAWMVGDRLEYDIEGAQRLGIYSIWCDYGKKGLPGGSPVIPDKIINNIIQLLSL